MADLVGNEHKCDQETLGQILLLILDMDWG